MIALSPLSPFQATCLREVTRYLRSRGIDAHFQRVEGETETYLKATFQHAARSLELYIYLDEAGFDDSRAWKICERQDFESDAQLIQGFLERLAAAL